MRSSTCRSCRGSVVRCCQGPTRAWMGPRPSGRCRPQLPHCCLSDRQAKSSQPERIMARRTRRKWLQDIIGTKGRIMKRPTLSVHALEDRTVPTGLPEMVLDINPNTYSSDPSTPVAIGSTTYFVTSNSLWKSDGTAVGTVLVKDFSISGMNTIPLY